MKTSDTLFKIVPITIYGSRKTVSTYAFLDDGSGPTLVEERVLKELEVGGEKSVLCLRWTDGTIHEEEKSLKTDIRVSPSGKSNKILLKNVRSVKRLDLPKQTMLKQEISQMYPHLKGLPLPDYIDAIPQIIIGIDNKNASMVLKYREGSVNEPTAVKTRLGWTVYGKLQVKTDTKTQSMTHLHVCECETNLHDLVLESFKLDNEGIVKKREITSRDLEVLRRSVTQGENYFTARLLWKTANVTLPDNERMAMRRLECFERKLLRDAHLKEKVEKRITEMEQKGYTRKLSEQERLKKSTRQWYLPMFVVQNPNKPSKIRIVWDAAAKEKGISLNDCLQKGPDLMSSLLEVLFNFRIGKFGICGDIAEMFHRIHIDPEDQQAQRFMWRKCDSSRPPQVYVLQAMSFGANCSPAIAQYVKNVNALRFEKAYPRAVESIMRYHYVDDMMDSVDTEEQCIELTQQVRMIHSKGNFVIRNWVSNSRKVLDALGEDGASKLFCKTAKYNDSIVEPEKVLGLWWQTTDDVFTFNLKYTKTTESILRGSSVPTKRQVLKLLMSLFDPLGLLAFFTVNLKILLQDVWRSGIDWDDEIPGEVVDVWNDWLYNLRFAENIKVPRCYFPTTNKDECKVDLHVFVDASERAYAAVAYFQTVSTDRVEVSLIGSKSKVAPIRPVSIPRMELMAAVLGVRYALSISSAHKVNVASRTFWTDSKTVLDWLRMDPRRLKQFVALRVAELQELSNLKEWRHISSKENVADLATKWHTPNFNFESRWFQGPSFLCGPVAGYQEPVLKNDNRREASDEEIQDIAVQAEGTTEVVNVSRFSKWERLVRCIAYVYKYIRLLKAASAARRNRIAVERNSEHADRLNAEDLARSYDFLHRQAQRVTFSSEIHTLNHNPLASLPKSSPLRKLSPFINKNGILRMRSRLANCTMIDEDARNPIILPKDHMITKLIVDSYHRKYRHIFHETAINEVSQRYHVPGLRVLYKKIRSNCAACKLQSARPNPPEMASLPVERASPFTRPFSYVGIDFFGPFLVTVGRRCDKRYGVVFTCLTCREVHLEIAHSLTTSSCIMAIRNFIGIRGQPLHVFSDNGTNFRAAEKDLKTAYEGVKFGEVENAFVGPHFRWSFLPPASPHMGGAWERMVALSKPRSTV